MFRCIAEACGKGFPRKVNFCPYCGTRQAVAAQPASRWGDAGTGAKAQAGAAAAQPAAGAEVDAAAKAAALAAARSGAAEQSRAGEQDWTGVKIWGADKAGADDKASANDRTDANGKAMAVSDQPGDNARTDEAARADGKAKAAADALARAEALAQARAMYAQDDAGAGDVKAADKLTADQQSALDRLNKLRGNAARPAAAGAPAADNPFRPQGNGPAPSRPPLRKPIGKSTWVSVAIVLGLIWFLARPSDPHKKLQARVDQAVAQAQDCKIDEARNEYTSLKNDKASAGQLKKLQDAIGANAKKCEAKRHRAKAWADLQPQLETALQNGSIDLADRRLAAFVKNWGADDDTRDWDGRIDVRKGERLLNDADNCLKRADRACVEAKLQAAEKLQRNELKPRIALLRESLSRLLESTVLDQRETPGILPRATPAIPTAPAAPAAPAAVQPAQSSQQAQQARKLLAEADRELRQGNYKAAMDKANICATMIDEGNRECLAMKNRAERMNRDLMNCVAGGREWIDDHCQ